MAAVKARRIFVAGATGETGQVLVKLAEAAKVDFVPHRRPSTSGARPPDPRAAVVDLADREGLVKALAGATTIVQLIGTMRKRFAKGDTYETSDIGTTRQLVEAAKLAGVDHLVLLSSAGAGRPMGAYLQAKATAEAIVKESGLDWTIFRPSAFVGGAHKAIPGMAAITKLPGLGKFRPIKLEQLAGAILRVAVERAPVGEVLEGERLWAVVPR